MAEDAVDFNEINYNEFKDKISQIERVFDVEVTVSGPTNESEECDISCEKANSEYNLRIFSKSGSKQFVAEAKVSNFQKLK